MKKIKKFFKGFVVKEHQLVAKDEELLRILDVFDQYGINDYKIVKCGWIANTSWCVYFEVSEKDWECLARDLRNLNLEKILVFGKDREYILEAGVE